MSGSRPASRGSVQISAPPWARAFERWADVSRMANPTGWVYRVAVNVGRNRVRRRLLERRKPILPDRDRPDIEGVADPALAAALVRLTLEQRMVEVAPFEEREVRLVTGEPLRPGEEQHRRDHAHHRRRRRVDDPAKEVRCRRAGRDAGRGDGDARYGGDDDHPQIRLIAPQARAHGERRARAGREHDRKC